MTQTKEVTLVDIMCYYCLKQLIQRVVRVGYHQYSKVGTRAQRMSQTGRKDGVVIF